MMFRVDLRGVEKNATDLPSLQAYLQQLVGQPFLHFRFSYGDELSLHFGSERPYASAKMKHLTKGSYILGTRASKWLLRSETRSVVVLGGKEVETQFTSPLKPLSREELESSGIIQRGSQIVGANAMSFNFPEVSGFPDAPTCGFGLSLHFSDGSSILVAPEASADDHEVQIADWELFTPYERFLRVGPGLHWSYLPSRQPSPVAQST